MITIIIIIIVTIIILIRITITSRIISFLVHGTAYPRRRPNSWQTHLTPKGAQHARFAINMPSNVKTPPPTPRSSRCHPRPTSAGKACKCQQGARGTKPANPPKAKQEGTEPQAASAEARGAEPHGARPTGAKTKATHGGGQSPRVQGAEARGQSPRVNGAEARGQSPGRKACKSLPEGGGTEPGDPTQAGQEGQSPQEQGAAMRGAKR